jgi:hypothetical protein
VEAKASAGQPAAPGSAPTPRALKSGQGAEKPVWVDWPILVKQHKLAPVKYLFVRSDGQLVCLHLCPVDYRCPRAALREPPCLKTNEAYEYIVPTVFTADPGISERLPHKTFGEWREAAEAALSLAEQYIKQEEVEPW